MVVYLEQNADKMKKTYLLLPVFLLFSCCLFAQNWWPVKAGETYHYRLPDSTYITHSIRVDSVKAQGSDSVFYLNRIVSWHNISGETLALYKQGQFLGQTMTKKPDGRLIFEAQNFIFDTSIVVYPNANLGDSWLAVLDGNITATVSSVAVSVVLGIQDSIKTIQFSNGAEWVISRQHGIISIPDFNTGNAQATLSGLEIQGLGDRLYKLGDFFDFNVGDVFEYASDSETFTGSTGTITKITILEKQIASPDTFQYLVDRRRKIEQSGLFNGISYSHDSDKLTFYKKDFKNITAYNRQIITPFSNPERYSFTTHFGAGIQMGNQFPASDTPEMCSALRIPDDPNHLAFYVDDALDCGLGDNSGIYFYYEEFRPHLGQVEYCRSEIDYIFCEWLTGAVIQGDTLYGSVKPDWFFTQTKEPKTISQPLKIYPNPAADLAIIEVGTPIGSATIQILGPEGKLIRTIQIETQDNTVKLDLADLPTGVYFVLLQSETEIRRGKLLISSLRRP